MYSIDYSSDDKVVRVNFQGLISLKQILGVSNEVIKNSQLSVIKILSDIRQASFDFKVRELDNVIATTKPIWRPQSKIFEAILINSPKDTALIILLELRRRRESHISKIFCTEESALDWLNSPFISTFRSNADKAEENLTAERINRI